VAISGLEQLGCLGVEVGLGLLGLALEVVRAFGGLLLVVLGRVRRLLQLDGLLVELADAIVSAIALSRNPISSLSLCDS